MALIVFLFPLPQRFSEPPGKELYCRCIPWRWAPQNQLFSALWQVVCFCNGLHLLQGEASLMWGENYMLSVGIMMSFIYCNHVGFILENARMVQHI